MLGSPFSLGHTAAALGLVRSPVTRNENHVKAVAGGVPRTRMMAGERCHAAAGAIVRRKNVGPTPGDPQPTTADQRKC
jgi:hypothetical protein